jgi:hypothetical protein
MVMGLNPKICVGRIPDLSACLTPCPVVIGPGGFLCAAPLAQLRAGALAETRMFAGPAEGSSPAVVCLLCGGAWWASSVLLLTARRSTGRNQDVRRAHGGVVSRRSLSTMWRCLVGVVGPPPRPRSRRSPCSLVETSPRVASQAPLLTIYASAFSGIAPLRCCFKSQLKRGNRCESASLGFVPLPLWDN